MARDEKVRKRGQPRLNRHSYLELASAAATTAVGGAVAKFRRLGTGTTEDEIFAGIVRSGNDDYQLSGNTTQFQVGDNATVTFESNDG